MIYILAAGDLFLSAGTRTYFRNFIYHLELLGEEVRFCFFQFRMKGVPTPDKNGYVRITDFSRPVCCPSTVAAFDRLPRSLFRLYERCLLGLHLKRWINLIEEKDRLILHGALGALHLISKKWQNNRTWWLKLGILEEESTGGIRFRFRKRIERLNSKNFGRRLVVSRGMEKFLDTEYGMAQQGSFILPCLVDIEKFSSHAQRDLVRKRLGFDNRFVMLYLGTAAPWQCIFETIAFFKIYRQHCPQAFLWILTPDHQCFGDFLSSIPKEDYRMEFKRHDQLKDCMVAADIGILLRRRQLINRVASPLKFLEYMACGLPVIIGPEVGDYSKSVSEQKLGVIIDPENPSKWQESIEEIRSLTNSDDTIRERCREFAFSLSWQAYGNRLQNEFLS